MSMIKRKTLILSWLFTVACAHAPGQPVPIAAPDARLLQIEASDGGKEQMLSPDTELRVGQDFALSIELLSPGYVYMVKTPALGESERLVPGAGMTESLLAAGRVRLPNAGSWLRLGSFASQDRLCLLLSGQPLPLAEQKCPTASSGDDKGEPEPTPAKERKGEEKKREKDPPAGSTRAPDKANKVKVIRLMVQSSA
jgi:hypothetical protein